MKTILVLDDDDKFRGVLREMLSRAGYKIITATNGKDGIDLYRKEKPDLLITDIIMPEKPGAEVIFKLQKEFPDIKIIAMSGGGLGRAEDYLESVAAYSDVTRTLQKPFPMEGLLKMVKEILE